MTIPNEVIRTLAPGEVLFEQGDLGTEMYVVRSGQIRIYRTISNTTNDEEKSELVLCCMPAGEFFGEMALLESLPRSASAAAMEYTELVALDIDTLDHMLNRNPGIAIRMMKRLAGRIRSLDVRLEQLVGEGAQNKILDVLRWLLPLGLLEPGGVWIKIPGAVRNFNLGIQAGIGPEQLKVVIEQLSGAGIMEVVGDDLLIANNEKLIHYSNYLKLQRRYEGSGERDHSNDARHEGNTGAAIGHLLSTLSLNDDEIDKKQRNLAAQYERYLHLKRQFRQSAEEDT